jgi:thioredoxin-like negative regulator of GroEL
MIESAPVLIVNDKNFKEQVFNCTTPVVVAFEKKCWGAAHIMRPILEKIAVEYSNQIKFFVYNMDENSIISEYYKIRNSLTILVFNNDNIVEKTGLVSKEELERILQSYIHK